MNLASIKRVSVFASSAAFACVFCTGWNYAADFSVVNGNPNGPWSYGLKGGNNPAGPFSQFPDPGQNGAYLWWRNDANLYLGAPVAFKNLQSFSVNGVPGGKCALHPGFSGEIATARFTVPTTGPLHVTGSFGSGDGGLITAWIYIDGVEQLQVPGTGVQVDFDYQIQGHAGEVIDFMVGAYNDFYSDSTPLDIEISNAVGVSGNFSLTGFTGPHYSGPLGAEVWKNGNLEETVTASFSASNGTYNLIPTVSGDLVLKFRFHSGLVKAVPVTLPDGGALSGVNVDMISGDIDHNNVVDLGDFDRLAIAFGQELAGNDDYPYSSDLNGDGVIDLGDFDIFASCFGSEGD